MKNISPKYTGSFDFLLHNPWWEEKALINQDAKIKEFEEKKFKYFHPLIRDFPSDTDCLLSLRGPRRIGKTTTIKLLIRTLLEKGIEPFRVFFYTSEKISNFKELYQILLDYLAFVRPKTQKRLFIFVDEISFVEEWERAVKELIDMGSLKNSSILVSSSSSLDLAVSAGRLAGRRGKISQPDIPFYPLNFSEFLLFVKKEIFDQEGKISLLHLPQVQSLFNDFLLTGGFPVTINDYYSQGMIPTIHYSTFISWFEADLLRTGKSEKTAYNLIERLFEHLTTPTSYYALAKKANIPSHATVMEYLDVLAKMFIVFDLDCFLVSSKRRDVKKNRKIYFLDPFIFNCLKAKISGAIENGFNFSQGKVLTKENKPLLVENAVASHLKRKFQEFLYYGKVKDKEIDFVGLKEGKYSYFEVKYQTQVNPQDFAWTKKVLGKNKLTVLSQKDYQENKISLIPAEMFLGYF